MKYSNIRSHFLVGLMILLWILAAQQPIYGQRYLEMMMNPSEDVTFFDIQQEANAYFAAHPTDRGSGYVQYKRWEWYMQDRLGPGGTLINPTKMSWDEYHRYENEAAYKTNSGYWNPVAPYDGYVLGNSGYNPGLGRVNVVAFHPSEVNTIFIGTPAGGLWKTTDGGMNWFPLTDGIPSIGVSGIAVHPSNPSIIYILTGDGDAGETRSIGVLKSTNGGDTWHSTALSWDVRNGRRAYKLRMHPNNPNTLFVAADNGIYKTTNGGLSWPSKPTQGGGNYFTDIEFKPGDPTTMYATHIGPGSSGGCGRCTFYKSTNSGESWFQSSTGFPTDYTRTEIAVTPDDDDIIYCLAGPTTDTGEFKGFYISTNSGDSWTLQSNTPNIIDNTLNGDGTREQSYYDLALAADPNDADVVTTGGINVWRTTNGGTSFGIIAHWRWSTVQANNLEYTHADIHDLVYNPLDGVLYCGSDGGIYKSTDDGVTWSDIGSVGVTTNGLRNMQFYRIADYPGNAGIIIGGTQDNGSNRWNGGNSIVHFDGADGMDCMIDYTDDQIQYSSQQNGALRRSTNGGINLTGIRPGGSGGGWVTPYDMDPIDPQIIYGGYEDTLWRSTNRGSNWTPSVVTLGIGILRSVHVAPANGARIYAATGQRIFRTTNTGGSWTEITNTLPVNSNAGVNITYIATDVNNENDVWVTLSGYSAGNKVFFSTNSGDTWQNISGSLPNLPANCVVYDVLETAGDNAVYVAMDVGVYYRDASLSDWVPFLNGLPHGPIFDLEYHVGTEKLRAGTYGRGLWETPVYTTCPTAYALTDANKPGEGEGFRFYQSSVEITSTRTLHAGTGNREYYASQKVRLLPGFHVYDKTFFNAYVDNCGSGVPTAFKITGTYAGPLDGVLEEVSDPANEFEDEITEGKIKVFPNPVKDRGFVEFSLPEAAVISVWLVDLQGKKVVSAIDSEQKDAGSYKASFDVSGLASGMYFVRVKAGDIELTEKIMVKR